MTNHNLNSQQIKQLQEIGLKLNLLRTANNISLETVAANTKITKRLLEAIESGNVAELPEPFYIRALVTKFAQAIGATDVEFRLEQNSPSQSASPVSPTTVSPTTPRRRWFDFQLRSLHLYLLYVFLVIVSVKGITILVEPPVVINQVIESEPVDDAPATKETSPVDSQPQSVPQFISQSSNSDSVTVGINLQERCWLKVMVDGKLAFEGTLPQGTIRQWTGNQEVTIRAGNAGGVVISFNNEQKKVLGAPGEVEEITYTVN